MKNIVDSLHSTNKVTRGERYMMSCLLTLCLDYSRDQSSYQVLVKQR